MNPHIKLNLTNLTNTIATFLSTLQTNSFNSYKKSQDSRLDSTALSMITLGHYAILPLKIIRIPKEF